MRKWLATRSIIFLRILRTAAQTRGALLRIFQQLIRPLLRHLRIFWVVAGRGDARLHPLCKGAYHHSCEALFFF